MKQYGIPQENIAYSENDFHIENIKRKGFTVIENVVSTTEIIQYKNRCESIYQRQVAEVDENYLIALSEENMARACLSYDPYFLSLTRNEKLTPILTHFLGEYYILNQQNAIINRPNKTHHQTAWHRDLPYQQFTSSKPISLSTLIAIDDFLETNGATHFLPYSHLFAEAPSSTFFDSESIQISAKAGSAIVFDSMVYHKAGENMSSMTRIGLNQVFSIPILKQQIDFSLSITKESVPNEYHQVLGLNYPTCKSVNEYRSERYKKKMLSFSSKS